MAQKGDERRACTAGTNLLKTIDSAVTNALTNPTGSNFGDLSKFGIFLDRHLRFRRRGDGLEGKSVGRGCAGTGRTVGEGVEPKRIIT